MLGKRELVIVLPPIKTFQAPVPTIGVVPTMFAVVVVMQSVWLGIEATVVGKSSTKIVTVEIEVKQGEFEIDH